MSQETMETVGDSSQAATLMLLLPASYFVSEYYAYYRVGVVEEVAEQGQQIMD